MPAAIRSYVTAGVALVGASVISVSPIAPTIAAAPQQNVRSVSMDVDLTAASAANIPANLVNMFLNMPQAHVDAVNYWADSWVQSGNWWVYSQDNILGWDRANPAMAWSMMDLLLPIPALSKPYGRHVQWWMAANLPMHEGCSGLPPCPNSQEMLNSMFRVGAWEFYFGDGYTFGPDGYTPEFEPVGPGESYWGYEYGETGDPVPWYGQTVKLDPFEGWKSLVEYLMADPEEVKVPSFYETLAAYMKFGATLVTMYNPFVPQSYIWNPRYSASAYLLRPFAKYLCPQCNKYDPFMPVDWKPGDPIPTPVDDGWMPGTPSSGTPTGLPLPTEAEPEEPGNGESAILVGGTWPTNILTDDQMKSVLGGYFSDYSSRTNIVYPGSLSDPFFSVALGAGILMTQIQRTPGPKTIYGFSQGALVTNLALALLANNPSAPAKEDLKIVLVADPSRGPNNAYQYVLVPETKYDITVLTNEYDGVADFPDRWWNAVAVANALAGISQVHMTSPDTDLSTVPDEYKKTTCNSKGGCTTTVFIPSDELPLVKVLPFLKPYEEQLKKWIDAGYSRNDVPAESGVAGLIGDETPAEETEEEPTGEETTTPGEQTGGEAGGETEEQTNPLAEVISNLQEKFNGAAGEPEEEQEESGEAAPEAGTEADPETQPETEVDPETEPAEPAAEGEGGEAPEQDPEEGADEGTEEGADTGKDTKLTVSDIQKRLASEAAGDKKDAEKDSDKKDEAPKADSDKKDDADKGGNDKDSKKDNDSKSGDKAA